MLWSDSESSYMQLFKKSTCSKKVLELRVSRLLAWVWENFSKGRLDIKFVLGEYIKGADTLSKWGLRKFGGVIDGNDQIKHHEGEGSKDGEDLKVHPCMVAGEEDLDK